MWPVSRLTLVGVALSGEDLELTQKFNGKVNANHEAPVKRTRSVRKKASGDRRIPSVPALGEENCKFADVYMNFSRRRLF